MPRPRKKQRDYKAEYERRQQRAREAGFGSYYARRVRGGAAAVPGAAAPSGAALRRARGHAGRAAFLADLEPGDLVLLADHISSVEKDARGRFTFRKRVISDRRVEERVYTIRRVTVAGLRKLIEAELRAGAILTPIPSLDQRRLIPRLIPEASVE